MDEQDDVKQPLLPPTLPSWWRVIPFLIVFMIVTTSDNLILNDFIEYRYTIKYQLNSSTPSNTRDVCLNATQMGRNSTRGVYTTTSQYPTTTTTLSPSNQIQASTARLNVFISLSATIPAICTSVLLGANGDKIGRKPLIALPFIGKIMRYFILTATAYYSLPDICIILAVMFDGLFGTSGLIILGSFAYISDCTKTKARTKAIIITDVCISCTKFIPLMTIGIYLQNPNYIQSMILILLISLAGFVFCIILQPESNLNFRHLNIFQQLAKTKLREVTKIFRVFLVKRQGHKQRSLLILVGAQLCMITMAYGYSAVQYLYLYGPPFCFDSFGVSLTSVASTVTTVLLTTTFTLVVRKRSDHLILPILGFSAHIAQLVLFGLANQVWMIYLAVCFGGLYHVLSPVIRSRITKLVEANEYAVVFIFALIFESGGSYAINALANEIYRASLEFYSGLVYFVFSLFGLLGIFLLSTLYFLERRSPVVETALVLNE